MGEESSSKLKIAFIATGTEGAGTHMLRDFLVAAGCNWRQDDERHKATYGFDEVEYPFVFHRSIPHSGAYPDFLAVTHEIREANAHPYFLLIVRDGNAVSQSVARRHNFDHTAYNHYGYQRHAIHWVGRYISRHMFDLITYEAFCLQEKYRRWLVERRWRLTYPEDFEIKFANDKYYND